MHDVNNQQDPGPPSLAAAIAALRRDVMAALEDKTLLPEGARLEADRVIITLRVAFADGQFQPLTGSHSGQAHTISIEFSVSRPAALPATSTALSAASAEAVVNALMEVFGVPSFDSSARATVFRETVSAISESQVVPLMAALGTASSAEVPAELKSARHMINRLLEKGPAGFQRGAYVLQEMARHHPWPALLRIIEETWKTPGAWAR